MTTVLGWLPIEAVVDPVLVVSSAGRVVAANRRAEALFGVPALGLLVVPVNRLATTALQLCGKSDPDAKPPHSSFQRVVGVRADGSHFPAVFLCAPLQSAGDSQTAITVRDLGSLDETDNPALLALRQSEERLETTLHSIGDAVIVTDAQGHVTRMNPVAETLTGWSFGEANAKPLDEIFRIINETTRKTVESPVARVCREGVIVGLANHTLLVARDGSERPIADSGAPIRDTRGLLTGVVMVFRDQTQEHAAERALRESENRFRTLLEAAPDALLSVDAQGRIVLANRQVEALFGYTTEELLGQPIEVLIPARLHAAHTGHRARYGVSAHARRMGSDTRLTGRRKDGTEFFVDVSLSPANTEAGSLVTAAVRDVSDRVRVQQALAASEERFRTLVGSLDDIVYTLDAQLRFSRFYGRSLARESLLPESYLGKTAREVLGDEPAAVHEAAYRRALAGERVVYESETTRDGQRRAFQTALSPLRDASGETTGLVGVAREVTELKRAQTQLMVAERMASVGMLVAGVAHEINNPLTAVSINLQLACDELTKRVAQDQSLRTLSDEARDALTATGRVQAIVHDLLVFSRGSASEPAEPVDVRAVLESTIRIARNELHHRARVVKDFHAVPAVLANETRLAQVFLNVIINAAQALPEGSANSHEIRLVTRSDGPGHVVVEVHDTGPGMPPEVLQNLFTPFFTTKPLGVGTGLGLAICQRILASFGGTIEAHSELGTGSVFRLRLPAAQAAVAPPAPALDRPAQSSARGRVLVVDDDPIVATTLVRTLRRDHEVVAAHDGHSALERLRSGERFDVIICDLMMPQMMGMDLYVAIDAVDPEQAKRMVFLSGGVFSARTAEFLQRVPNACLEKPYDMDRLRVLVSDWVTHGPTSRHSKLAAPR